MQPHDGEGGSLPRFLYASGMFLWEPFEILFERERMAVLGVLCAIDQRDRAAAHLFHELLDGIGIVPELLEITVAEFVPS